MLTTDAAWHDLDLSDIIPLGAKTVSIRVLVMDNTSDYVVRLRKNGNVNSANVAGVTHQISGITYEADLIVAVDDDRIIEYITTSASFSKLHFTIKGWWF